ncbi:MAG TPA: hypothetical protein VN785_10520 [Candidatus Angelobacter sp.]|nr:hypothetical protein [Candidatus Angelobacter sp.]
MRKYRFLQWFLLAFVMLAVPAASHAQVRIGVSVRIGPPALPVYEQPLCPGPGYIWTPGYWAYGDDGYYWVPGTWVMAPEPGLLWTPGYWGWGDGIYVWHRGYWGRHVGFYGGINYGFGYPGVGFFGGEWRGREFFYNRSVNRVDVHIIRNVYDRRVDDHFDRDRDRVSFNGGRGGVDARPNREEEFADHDRHFDATRDQVEHRDEASHNRAQFANFNHGRPDVAATPRPGQFNDRGAIRGNDRGERFGDHANDARGNDNHRDFHNPDARADNRGDFRNRNARADNRGDLRNDNRNRQDNRPSRQDNVRPQRDQRNQKNNANRHPDKEKPNHKPDGRDHRL